MKKNLVKVLTLALAAAMVAGMSAMAMPVSALSDTDTKTITVRDINKKDAGTATVKAYQIVKYNYSDPTNLYELTAIATAAGVKKVDDLKADKIKAETVEDLANADTPTTAAYTLTKNAADNTVYETTVPGGLYLVIVTGDNALVYNPALVSVNINDKDELIMQPFSEAVEEIAGAADSEDDSEDDGDDDGEDGEDDSDDAAQAVFSGSHFSSGRKKANGK